MTSLKLAATITAVALLGGGAALAQEQGTWAQREACTPDAFRLCGHLIPDATRIKQCLRDAGPRLSAACYVVFYPPQDNKPPLRTVRRDAEQPAPDEGRVATFGRW